MLPSTALRVEEIDQIVPATSRKVFVAVDERGLRIGETHPNADLTDHEVDLMRELREKDDKSYAWLAEKFEVPKVTVQMICTYKRRAATIARWKVLLLHTPISLTNQPEDNTMDAPTTAANSPAEAPAAAPQLTPAQQAAQDDIERGNYVKMLQTCMPTLNAEVLAARFMLSELTGRRDVQVRKRVFMKAAGKIVGGLPPFADAALRVIAGQKRK